MNNSNNELRIERSAAPFFLIFAFLRASGMRALIISSTLCTLCGFSDTDMRIANLLYTIENGSSLSISGSSNVNTFSCLCGETFKKQVLQMVRIDSTRQLRFKDAVLKLPTQSMDCSNARMNSDLCDALKASKYPYIVVELHQVNLKPSALQAKNDEWFDVVAVATLTITDVCKPIVMDVKGLNLGGDRYRFVCSTKVRMTDFNVEPPSVLLGLIKVNNDIKINLDITASIARKM